MSKEISLSAFRTYCRRYLLDDLKEYEDRRHTALKALAVGGTVVAIILTVTVTQTFKALRRDSVPVSTLSEADCHHAFEASGVRERMASEGRLSLVANAYTQFQLVCVVQSPVQSKHQPELPAKSCRASITADVSQENIDPYLNLTAEEYEKAYSILQAACQGDTVSSRSFNFSRLIFLLSPAILVFCVWGWAIFYSTQKEMYEYHFKKRVISQVFDFFNIHWNLRYTDFSDDYQRHEMRVALLTSNLFPSLGQMPYIQQEDCTFGRIGSANIYFAEISAEQEIHHLFMQAWMLTSLQGMAYLGEHWAGFLLYWVFNVFTLPLLALYLCLSLIKAGPYVVGRTIKGQHFDYDNFRAQASNQVTRRQVFKGLFFKTEFPKNFQGRMIIYPSSLTANLKQFTKPKGSLVKLEDPEFNRLFTVYSDDQVEARYILSTSLMDRLVKFRQKAQRPVSISFVNNQIFIAIHHERDLFEARLFETMLSFKPMQDYFENFQLMLGIIEDLNLNRRIWGR